MKKLRKFCNCGKPIDDYMDKCADCIIYEIPLGDRKKPKYQNAILRD